jgi:hypothetical protein
MDFVDKNGIVNLDDKFKEPGWRFAMAVAGRHAEGSVLVCYS